MSRIGKLPIILPQGTEAKISDKTVTIKGPKGELKEAIHKIAIVTMNGQEISVSVANQEDKKEKSLWGLTRSLIYNMVVGVNSGYEKKLEINGVGYRASVSGDAVVLNLGYSHPINFSLPAGIVAKVEKNIITIQGIDKQLVGETAAQIRRLRKPEPYKGKGIKYSDEIVRRKAGKTSAKGGKK